MKYILKFLAFAILGVVAALFVGWLIFDETEPEGVAGPEADSLAHSMMQAVNYPAWEDIKLIQWTYRDEQTFQWDKVRHKCRVTWGDFEVLLDINSVQGIASENGVLLDKSDNLDMVRQAWNQFNNASFWLNPVVKAFDPGTERNLVNLKNGTRGLKVHYSQGGNTPGDSYLWLLNEHHLPVAWKMWVQILPVGGMRFTWEDWVTLPGGALISTTHRYYGVTVRITDLKTAETWSEWGFNEDPLQAL